MYASFKSRETATRPLLAQRHVRLAASDSDFSDNEDMSDIQPAPRGFALEALPRHEPSAQWSIPSRSVFSRVAGAVSRAIRPRRTAADISFAIAMVPYPRQAPIPTGPYPWRPAPAFQHLQELIDGIASAPPQQLEDISRALSRRLRRADLRLPEPACSQEVASRILMGRQWLGPVESGSLHISDLVGLIPMRETLPPARRQEFVRRLTGALETALEVLAQGHQGVAALLAEPARACRALPPLSACAGPRMQVFDNNARALFALPAMRSYTPGRLAVRLYECLHCGLPLRHEEEAGLVGRIMPAVEALIADSDIAPDCADTAREAAWRLENYLQVAACLDVPTPDLARGGTWGTRAMTPRQARGILFSKLMLQALDPARLDALLDTQALGALLHDSVLAQPRNAESPADVIGLLRQTLRPMLDSGLVSNDQRRMLMRLAKQALRPSEPRRTSAPAGITGSTTTTL